MWVSRERFPADFRRGIATTNISLDFAAATASHFALEVLGKNCCLVEGVLHLPGNPSIYFLLSIRSILARPVGPRHYPNHTTPGPVVPHSNNYHLGPDPVKKEL
ncbi:hypothetical protein JHK82_024438 [Glycine max]|nr:hypothetical protein JHK82_024438 [Glycine max]